MLLMSCASGSDLPDSAPGTGADTPTTPTPAPTTADTSAPEVSAAPTTAETSGDASAIVIDVSGPGKEIDDRVFGVNVPAWLGPERFEDPLFVARAQESGATIVRMPGGSWSNGYRWEACELRDESRCFWPWASRPSDFIGFLRASGLPGMWTVSINETAQSAAAAVAFFNGEVGDQTVIGVDRNGVDWGNVDRWASIRAFGGHPEPVGLQLWEVGNEVFGGRPEAGGEECASFGWEDVWTCDGREYVLGDEEYDGYLAIRSAMVEIDPTIEVGAVGVSQPSEWSGWGDEVIEESGDALDFYIVHAYGFDSSPSGDEAVDRVVELWPRELGPITDRLGEIPVAITEYNLVSFESGDTELTMTKAMNALYIADTLGQLVEHDIPIATMWTLASGSCLSDCLPSWSGTDYGMVRQDGWETLPSFEAFRAWKRAGTHRADAVIDGDLRFYPTRDETGRVAVIVLNTRGQVTVPVVLEGVSPGSAATLSGVTADSLEAEQMSEFDAVPVEIGPDGAVVLDLPPHSITVLEVAA